MNDHSVESESYPCIVGRVVKALDLRPNGHTSARVRTSHNAVYILRFDVMFITIGVWLRDSVSEWLRSQIRNLMGSARASSILVAVVLFYFLVAWIKRTNKKTTPVRFELTRAEPNRFLIYRLNHSAKVSCLKKSCVLRGSNPCLSREWRLKPPP